MSDAGIDPMVQMTFSDLAGEMANTRKMIAALPESHFEFRPDPKSWTLVQLAQHVVELVGWGPGIVQTTEFDLATAPKRGETPSQTAALVATLDGNIEALEAKVATMKPADLAEMWTLRFGDRVVMTMPRGTVLRMMCLSHIIHHRAQLSVYLRLVGSATPGMYGPSADEQ